MNAKLHTRNLKRNRGWIAYSATLPRVRIRKWATRMLARMHRSYIHEGVLLCCEPSAVRKVGVDR